MPTGPQKAYPLIVDNDRFLYLSIPSKLILQIPLPGPDTESKDTEDIVGSDLGGWRSRSRSRGVVVGSVVGHWSRHE
jgi:hypothetical protein